MKREQLDALLAAVEAEECRRDFYAFVKRFWKVVEPGADYVDNWHVEAICLHLQAVTEGKIKRLVINVPFRTAKSTITSVLWPAWVWIDRPHHQWLCGSYAEKLSLRDSLRMRRLVQSPEYRKFYGGSFDIASDQNQKIRFQNTKNGYRIAFGMTGGVMGDGGDTLLIDDPHDRQGAHSEAERETALTTYDEALITRLNSPATGAIVIIMQRLHQKDLSGHVLADKAAGWVHLMIPMEFEAARKCKTSIGWEDPRKKEGELMFPARFPAQTVASLKTTLGEYGAAGQLQQRPSPAGGGILKPEKFLMWPANQPLPDFSFILQSYDTAYTEKTQNDPTACTVWGVFEHAKRKHAMLLEAWTDHMEYPQLRKRLMEDWKAEYGGIAGDPMHPSRRADVVLIEEKGSGQSVIQDMRAANIPVVAYNPGRADKIARAHMTAPLLEAGSFYVLESKKDPGQPIRWARPLLLQMEQFPNGEHDDLCVAKGTLIEMGDGAFLPIEQITAGCFVATPVGPRLVTQARSTGRRQLWSVRAGGNVLLATANHPVAIEDGRYVRVDALQGDRVQCRLLPSYQVVKSRLLYSMGAGIGAIRTQPTRLIAGISAALERFCIGMSGSTSMVPFPMALTCTTKTKTPAITTSRTSKCSRGQSTGQCVTAEKPPTPIRTSNFDIWTQSDHLRLNGTGLKKVALGIGRTLSEQSKSNVEKERSTDASASRLTRCVSGAALNSWRTALKLCTAVVAAKPASRDFVASAKAQPLQRIGEVFNLTVEGAHCYYANGILTHNCDTFTQAGIYLRDSNLLTLDRVEDEPPEDIDYHERKRSKANPYFA